MKKFVAIALLLVMVCMEGYAEVKVSTIWNGHFIEQTAVHYTDDTGYVKINVDDTGCIYTLVLFEGTYIMITHAGNRIDLIDYGVRKDYTDFRSMVDLNLAIEMIHLRDMACK